MPGYRALNFPDAGQSKLVTDNEDELNADFPPGPLDLYRKNSSFDWKVMRTTIEDEKILRFKVSFWTVRCTFQIEIILM